MEAIGHDKRGLYLFLGSAGSLKRNKRKYFY